MKILYIGNKLAHSGMSPTTIDTLSQYLKKEGFSVVCFSNKKNTVIRFLHMIYGVIKNNDAKYVIIDTYSTTAFWFAFLISQLCRILNMKYIPYLHGGNLPKRLETNPKISKLIFNNSYLNAAPSNFLKNEFENKGFKNLIFVPNTIEIKNYKFENRKIDTPKILWVRSFANLYNPKLAIDVLAELKKTFCNAELTMVGPDKDGSLDTTKQYAIDKGVKVNFTGKLSKKEWITMSSKFNIFLNTTNFDNTPVSVMEAMALGLPVVSTNVGGLSYLIQNNIDGILTNPNNYSEMTNAILYLKNNDKFAQEIIFNAREKAEKWDWNSIKTIWKQILKE